MGLFTNLIQTKLFTKLAGDFVGEDDYGNKYYQEKLLLGKPQRPAKRWVIYKSGSVEASNVPAKWFGWLHYTYEKPLASSSHKWKKPHQFNLTGSNEAYHPKSSLLNATAAEYKSPVPKPYQAWDPTADDTTTTSSKQDN